MISKDKKYKTKLGLPVVIYAIYPEQLQIHGVIFDKNGIIITQDKWDLEGNAIGMNRDESCNSLIEVNPYENFKIDDKVLVWNYDPIKESLKTNRYFAGIDEEGRPMAWVNGATSWSVKAKETWYKCEKYEETNDKT